MNHLYLITTATQQSQKIYSLNGRFCILADTELEAVAIAIADQPDNTYIFSIAVYLPPIYFHTFFSRLPYFFQQN